MQHALDGSGGSVGDGVEEGEGQEGVLFNAFGTNAEGGGGWKRGLEELGRDGGRGGEGRGCRARRRGLRPRVRVVVQGLRGASCNTRWL